MPIGSNHWFARLIRQAAPSEPVVRRSLLTEAVALADEELLADEPYAKWVQAPEALRLHARCQRSLSETLGVDPTEQTAEVHVAILRGVGPATLLGQHAGHTSASRHRLRAASPISYADNGGVRIAYQVIGTGPIDLVFARSFITNLAASWDDPIYAGFLRESAAGEDSASSSPAITLTASPG